MPDERTPDLSLFLDILHTLEAIGAPYMIIGAFAATVYGSTVDIYEMMIFHYLGADRAQSMSFDEAYVDAQVQVLGVDVAELWEAIKDAARHEAARAKK